MNKFLLLLFLLFSLAGCDLIDYHPYDVKIDCEKNINSKSALEIEAACQGKDTVRFVWMGDSQRWYDELAELVSSVNQRADSIDFLIHGGDISDFGMTKEFEWTVHIMKSLKMPYLSLIGNHDCLGTGFNVFEKIYGTDNFSFMASNIRFVCLNTNALEYDYSKAVPDFGFITQQIKEQQQGQKSIVLMHVPPFDEQFNDNVGIPFQEYIKRLENLQFCLHAHCHRLSARDIFDDGVIYYGCDCMKGRSYMLFRVYPDGYDYEVVNF